jgi:hypothetical protein
VGAGDPDKLSYVLPEVFDLNPKALVPGHGPVGEPDGLQLMRQYISTLDGLAHKMVENGEAEEKIDKMAVPEPLTDWFFLRSFLSTCASFISAGWNGRQMFRFELGSVQAEGCRLTVATGDAA